MNSSLLEFGWRIAAWFRNLTDSARQREINRLVIRSGRRCARDLRHAVQEISNPITREWYEQRSRMWLETFWDSGQYRDELHRTIETLETRIVRMRELLKENSIEEAPF